MIAIIGTSDRPCWLAEACKILLLQIWKKSQRLVVSYVKLCCNWRNMSQNPFFWVCEPPTLQWELPAEQAEVQCPCQVV